ncbi:unnamed protein product [Darwinula stevensoni]|uniref:Uncharacterized protein n=1 Tax=Darwinula stevensoni TaxID=69355 RepID=A0A7R9FRS7_9CRUS|nr:unnamed protein product [Darwinula stevensoni]CAG0901560.1 unnamed protein product [Darwinula stevensoni]
MENKVYAAWMSVENLPAVYKGDGVPSSLKRISFQGEVGVHWKFHTVPLMWALDRHVAGVKPLSSSKESLDLAESNHSIRKMVNEMNVSRSRKVTMVKNDLGLSSYRLQKRQFFNIATRSKRLARSRQMLEKFKNGSVPNTVFSHEKSEPFDYAV